MQSAAVTHTLVPRTKLPVVLKLVLPNPPPSSWNNVYVAKISAMARPSLGNAVRVCPEVVDGGGNIAVRVDGRVNDAMNGEIGCAPLADGVEDGRLGRGRRSRRHVDLDPEAAGQLVGRPGRRNRLDALCVALDGQVVGAAWRLRLVGGHPEKARRHGENCVVADSGAPGDRLPGDRRPAGRGCLNRVTRRDHPEQGSERDE